RVLSDGLYNYIYSESGEMVTRTEITTGRVTSYAYDHRGRLTSVVERERGGAVLKQVEYAYGVFDRRIPVTVNGEPTPTLYDEESAWADYDAPGAVAGRYLYGDAVDELLARWRPGEGTSWPLADRLGTIRVLLDGRGAVLNRTEYTAFGQILSQTNPAAAGR